jgi:hypothetical protein
VLTQLNLAAAHLHAKLRWVRLHGGADGIQAVSVQKLSDVLLSSLSVTSAHKVRKGPHQRLQSILTANHR